MHKFLLSLISLVFLSLQTSSQTCNNWLGTPSQGSKFSIGQLNVTGDKITVEALFNRTAPYSGGILWAGDLVSKLNGPADCNYLLRPNTAEITTNNGYFRTPDICEIQLNKTYHAAMVYDGTTLKFYRDGILMSQVAATGNLFQNTWKTTIGWYDPAFWNTQFIGYINEVRIWNVARTQAQIRTYMTSSLPNPTTQTGLQAYFTFDNLLNKQGNTTYNGVLSGAASINQTNPNCILVKDSCNTVPGGGSSVIVNTYTPVVGFDQCKNNIVVEDAGTFNSGDTVLMIQMKGAEIDSSNTASFGTLTNYKNAGNYEFNIIQGKTGNTIELKNSILRNYDVPLGRVQLIRVPYFQNYIASDTLTCLAWDGKKGGVLVLNVANNTTLNADINVSGRGFRGGSSRNSSSLTLTCNNNGVSYPSSSIEAADKGESIYELGNNNAYGKGANANGGGGGVGHNSGGGGGSNGGAGGLGGYQLEECGNAPFDNRGIGGNSLAYSNLARKVFMGGGGGSGHTDNSGGIDMNGGNGGGIAIIMTNTLTNNGFKIVSDGDNAQVCDNALNNCHDGNGGGGGGGTVLIKSAGFINNLDIQAKGGKGADLVIYNPGLGAGRVGPGGGGGGGAVWLSPAALPSNLVVNNAGGANGVIPADSNNPWGATPGSNGLSVFNLQIPVATIPFLPNFGALNIVTTPASCSSFKFHGAATTNTSPVQTWLWSFGDNTTGNGQDVVHSYGTVGTYPVKLVMTDGNGCKDSISTSVTTVSSSADFSFQQNICNPLSVQFFNAGPAPVNPAWIFGDAGTDIGSVNPIHVYTSPGNYTVKYSVQNGTCTDTVTKVIAIGSTAADIIYTKDTTICLGATKKLFTAPALSFCWSPTTALDDPLSPTPTTSTRASITYHFTAEIVGANLITNGDFNAGNSGFTSGYNFANPNTTEGEYFTGTNPQSWNAGLSNCGDHSSGTGNMLLVNGSPVPDVVVWKQTVTVTPNTNYAFATWIQALYPPNPAQLSFTINGKDAGNLITASLPTCTWTRFYTTWNSGNNTSAVISIINKNTLVQGNDFALDDISFAPVIIQTDSVKIAIDTAFVKAGNDTLVCEKNAVQLSATGALTYSWLPTAGLSNAAIANPVATVSDTTQYIVNGVTAAGCTAADTISIFTKPSPLISTLPDTGTCRGNSLQLSAAGGNSYSWLPAAGLSNAAIANPVTTTDTTISYIVSGLGSNGCTGFDTVTITVNPLPAVRTNRDTAICLGNTVQLTATGAATYSWSPATGLSNINSSNPIASVTDTTEYIVQGTSAKGCVANDTVNIFTRLLPVVSARNDTIICASTTVQLFANGAASYSWSPVTTLNNAGISNPVATPADTTQYFVKGTDVFGCSSRDSVTVFTKALPVITTLPDTGICKRSSLQLSAAGGNSYSWLPAAGLSNAGIQNPVTTTDTTISYIVSGLGSNGCTGFDTVTITVNPLPAVKTNRDTAVCLGNSVQLTATGAATYSWSPAAGLSNINSSNPIASVTDTTEYIVHGTSAKGCVANDTVNIFTRLLPVVSARNDTIICASTTVQLFANGAASYSWSPVATLNNAGISNPVATPADTTQYFVKGTDLFGCSNKDSVTVFTKPLPLVTLSGDTSICKNVPFQLTAGGGNNYQWSPAAGLSGATISNPVALIPSTTTYRVTVTGSNNCTAEDSVKLTVKASPVFTVSPSASACANKTVQLSAGGGNSYRWSPAALVSNDTIAQPFSLANSTTSFSVIITENTCHESDTLTTTLTVFTLPPVTASKSNDIDCVLLTAQLTASGADQYSWTPAEKLNNPAIPNPVATLSTSTLYTVTGTDLSTHCSNSDTVTISVNKAINKNLFIPNAFSPNNIGVNECWKPVYYGNYSNYSLSVYNRYGELVFHTENSNACWDGRYKGKRQDPGTYVFVLKIKTLCREEVKRGNLLLIQ